MGKRLFKNERRRHRDELGQVMGHPGLTTGYNESTYTAQVFIQHHGSVQPHTAIPRLARASLGPQTAIMDCHCAWKKQPAKADHSSLADIDYEI